MNEAKVVANFVSFHSFGLANIAFCTEFWAVQSVVGLFLSKIEGDC